MKKFLVILLLLVCGALLNFLLGQPVPDDLDGEPVEPVGDGDGDGVI